MVTLRFDCQPFAHRKRNLPTPEQLAKHGVRWAPHRTHAARYLWRAADSAANPIC